MSLSAGITPGTGAGVHAPQAAGSQRSAETFCFAPAQTFSIGVTVDATVTGKVVVGTSAVDATIELAPGVHRQASPTRPRGQPSLASVGSGMAAGAAIRAASSLRRGTSAPPDLFHNRTISEPYVVTQT